MQTASTFHLQLHHAPDDHDLVLHVAGRQYPVVAHGPISQAAAPALLARSSAGETAPEAVSHFAEGVQLPDYNMASYYVTSVAPGGGDEVLQAFGLHIPTLPAASAGHVALRAAAVASASVAKPTWEDMACSIIFHHPEILALSRAVKNPQTGAVTDAAQLTQDLIRGSLNFPDAVSAVRAVCLQMGNAAALPRKLVVDFDGNPVYLLDANGNPTTTQRYYFDYADELKQAIKPAMQAIIREVMDHPQLEGITWRTSAGQVAADANSAAPALATRQLMATELQATAEAAEALKLRFAHVNTQAGLSFDMTTTQTTDRSFNFTITNEFLRYVSIYIQFLKQSTDAQGNTVFETVPMEDSSFDLQGTDETTKIYREVIDLIKLETPKTRFLKLISATPTVLGIPYTTVEESFSIRMPDNADTARILAGGGFGFTYPSDLKMLIEQGDVTIASAVGLIVTGVVNLVVPTIMLAAATGDSEGIADKAIRKLLKSNPKVVKSVAKGGYALVSGLYKVAQPGQGAVQLLGEVANMLLGLTTSTVEILGVLAAATAVDEAQDQIPLAGQILQAASIIATAAELAETTTELLASPLVIENTVSISIDSTVTLAHDPLDTSGFPATAWVYELVCKYEKGMTFTLRDLPINRTSIQTDPLVNTFQNLPGAGQFTITATFYGKNEDGTINRKNPVGLGTSPQLDAARPEAQQVPITIQELLIPLTADTQYHQKRLLAFQDGQHVWSDDAGVPSATIKSLNPGEGTKSLSELVNLHFSQTTGYVGYAWKGSGQNVPLYNSQFPTQDDNFYTFQSINSRHDAEQNLKFSDAGFTGKVLLALELLPPELPNAEDIRQHPNPADPFWKQLGLARPPYNFFLQPNDDGNKLFVRQIDYLDGSASFKLDQTSCFGYFDVSGNMSLDSVAINPLGYVVGVSRPLAKLYISPIPHDPIDDALASPAILASGKGTRVNLLQDPVAVGCTSEGAILVLDAAARRVQAFDYRANPLYLFVSGDGPDKANYFALQDYGPNVTYLDLAVEHYGFVYVLLYTGDGATPTDYRVDIYEPDGRFLVSSTEAHPLALGKMSVDLFRNIYGLTFQAFGGPGGRIEPAVSELIPSLPQG